MPRKHDWNGEIMHIYTAYPRKVGRGAALPAIRRALDRLCAITPETFQDAPERFDPAKWLLQVVEAYGKAVAGRERRFIPHPSTWFNQERYLDDQSDWRNDGPGEPSVFIKPTNYDADKEMAWATKPPLDRAKQTIALCEGWLASGKFPPGKDRGDVNMMLRRAKRELELWSKQV